jgi:hypothetical protein
MNSKKGQIDKHRKLVDALYAVENLSGADDSESRGVFHVSTAVGVVGIGGPQGELPVDLAVFAIPQSVAHAMEDLAEAMQDSDTKFHISFTPAQLSILSRISEGEDKIAGYAPNTVYWKDGLAEAEKGVALPGLPTPVHSEEFIFTGFGDIWFQVTTDGPSVAEVYIERDIIREIAAGCDAVVRPGL